jgi:hypothetical protein
MEKHRLNPHARSSNGRRLIHLAVCEMPCLRYLLENNPKYVDVVDGDKRTALHYAALYGECVHVCMYVCMCLRMCVCVNVYIYMCVCVLCICVCVCVCMYVYVYMYIYIYIYIYYIHTHSHTYTHTYTQVAYNASCT